MLVFKGDKLLVRGDIFEFENSSPRCLSSSHVLPPIWQDTVPWCEIDDETSTADFSGADESEASEETWLDLRALWRKFGDEAFARASRPYQYMNWLRNTRFCARCAAPLTPSDTEKGLFCTSCNRVIYAPLHPAIIVAVERDDKLLLAHNTRMPTKRYSVLAGFVEPGESLEQTVAREIMEEVGIEVEDVRYFGSQSWPFPCSLMLGFTARWKKGELHPDGVELDDAGWFAPNELPEIPQSISISRRLIDDFVARKKGN